MHSIDVGVLFLDDSSASANTRPRPRTSFAFCLRTSAGGSTASLLTNSVKHTPAGGKVRLSLESSGGQAVLRVADNGNGIPNHLREIFLVALTGYGQQKDRDAVLEAGFDQHLVKPVEAETLLEVLRTRRALKSPVVRRLRSVLD